MIIKELYEFTKDELQKIRDDFQFFQSNDFKHLKTRVDWIFYFMLFVSASIIGTLIAVLARIITK